MGGLQSTQFREADVPEPDDEELSEDELFELLSNGRRRHVLDALMREESDVDIGRLAEEIAAVEDGLAYDEVSSNDRKRVYTALQQTHLPKMEEAGVIEFDRDRGAVEPTPALEDVEIYMDVVRGREWPWSDYYLGLTALSTVVLVASALSLYPFSALPAHAATVFVVVAFGVSALAHRYYARRNRLGIDGTPSGAIPRGADGAGSDGPRSQKTVHPRASDD